MTLEGEYQNIRRFIREIESSNQFVVVSTVELEGADAKEKREQKQIQRQATQTNQLRPNISQPTMEGFPVNPNANPIAVNPQQPKTQSQPKAASPKGKVRGELVSLRIEMAAYFRRNNIPNAVNLEVKQ